MSNQPENHPLIKAFLEAVRLRHLDRCQTILTELDHLAGQQPIFKPWRRYLAGYWIFEAEYDWAEADRIFAELLEIDLEPTLRRRVLYARGRSLDAQGRWAEAIAAFEQCSNLAIDLGQPIEQARAWRHMAISYNNGFTRGDFESTVLLRAKAYCHKALDILEHIKPSAADVEYLKGSIWNTLGLIHVSLSQWDQAVGCYQRDLAICQALDDRHGMGLTYGNLGEVYQKQGRAHWPAAVAAYQQALQLIREFDNRYDEAEALANIAYLYQETGDSNLALAHYAQAIDCIEGLRVNMSSAEARAGFFATIVNTYAHMVLLCLKIGRQVQAFDYIERARSRAFLDILIAGSADLSGKMEATILTLVDVQAALPPDAVLLEYFTTGLATAAGDHTVSGQETGPVPEAERHRFPPERTLLFAVTRDSLSVYDIGLSPRHIAPAGLIGAAESRFLKADILQKLYKRLIMPVEPLLQGKRRLYLVPHGPLHYVPFQALIAADGETLLRDTGPQLIYGPSATLLFRRRRTESAPAAVSCLALGYNSHDLYLAENEAQTIARLTAGQAVTGSSSKKAVLHQRAAACRLLHLACHGEFVPDSPLASFLQLAPDEKLSALEIIEQLQFQGDLVTLSACESGLSRIRRGDELMGLIRAFMYAGAPALVVTLWRTRDPIPHILMERFYQEISAGVGFAEALKRAQLYVKNLRYKEVASIVTPLIDLAAFAASPSEPASQKEIFGGSPHSGNQQDQKGSPAESNAKIYEAPFNWAGFFLVGDHGS